MVEVKLNIRDLIENLSDDHLWRAFLELLNRHDKETIEAMHEEIKINLIDLYEQLESDKKK